MKRTVTMMVNKFVFRVEFFIRMRRIFSRPVFGCIQIASKRVLIYVDFYTPSCVKICGIRPADFTYLGPEVLAWGNTPTSLSSKGLRGPRRYPGQAGHIRAPILHTHSHGFMRSSRDVSIGASKRDQFVHLCSAACHQEFSFWVRVCCSWSKPFNSPREPECGGLCSEVAKGPIAVVRSKRREGVCSSQRGWWGHRICQRKSTPKTTRYETQRRFLSFFHSTSRALQDEGFCGPPACRRLRLRMRCLRSWTSRAGAVPSVSCTI